MANMERQFGSDGQSGATLAEAGPGPWPGLCIEYICYGNMYVYMCVYLYIVLIILIF